MSFTPSTLKVLGGGAGFWLWHYRTEDKTADVLAPGHFNGHDRMLARGHMVVFVAADGAGILVVTDVSRYGATVAQLGAVPLVAEQEAAA